MAMGAPIVATSLGAEGYPVESGRQLILADKPESFAEAVVCLLRDEERRADLRRTARSFVEERYDWSVIVPRVEEVYAT
jgi:glycosyltransferase involved in cell wall biosynthesis